MRCYAVLVIFASLGIVLGRNPIVETQFGEIRGFWGITNRFAQVAQFVGIPYAVPPLGELRFKASEPWNETWKGVRDAVDFLPPCHDDADHDSGNEDCLYLNVFVPAKVLLDTSVKPIGDNSTSKVPGLPVIVFLVDNILFGSQSYLYTPDYLLNQEVLLVTVTYRRGLLGYFATGDESAPGNYGLKDVLVALEWIRNNVDAFGGDPDLVTLAGQSSGASVVQLLALSKKSRGLFHRYVTQSGAATSPWAYRERNSVISVSLKLAETVGCSNGTNESNLNTTEIVECLRGLNVSELLRASGADNDWNSPPWGLYGPTNEPKSDEAVITEHPEKLMAEGKMSDIPWLTGVVAGEGLGIDLYPFENWTWCLDPIEVLKMHFEVFDLKNMVNNEDKFLESLADYYFEENKTRDNCEESMQTLLGDAYVTWPVYESLQYQTNTKKSNAYLYNFAYRGTFSSTFSKGNTPRYGVCHSDDINYLFPVLNTLFENLKLSNNNDDVTIINIITEMWTRFAKTGVPGANFSPKWEPYRDADGYMEFRMSSDYSMKNGFLADRMKFWNKLWEKYSSKTPVAMKKWKGTNGSSRRILGARSWLLTSLIIALYVSY